MTLDLPAYQLVEMEKNLLEQGTRLHETRLERLEIMCFFSSYSVTSFIYLCYLFCFMFIALFFKVCYYIFSQIYFSMSSL